MIDDDGRARLLQGMNGLKARAKTLVELAENARFYVRQRPLELDAKAAGMLTAEARAVLSANAAALSQVSSWTAAALEQADRDFAADKALKLGQVAQPKRAALTGTTSSPPIYEVMEVLGRDESLGRLADALATK
jgi:glutamyl-tRNA synthetase